MINIRENYWAIEVPEGAAGRIYTLSDPRNNTIMYVGSTTLSLNERLKRHLRSIALDSKNNKLKTDWFLSLKSAGLAPIIEVIDIATTKNELFILEEYWTYQLRTWGFPLTNRYYGRKMGAECRSIMKERCKDNKIGREVIIAAIEKTKRSVLQRNMAGEIVGWWRFLSEAERKLSIQKGKISRVCQKRGYSAGGFRWEYCSEETYNEMTRFIHIPS